MTKNINTRVRLNYTATDADTNDTILDLELSFDNADYHKLQENLNIWLAATGFALVVRPKHEVIPSQRDVAVPREDLYKRAERSN